jgi:hypothetical protein
MSSTSWISITSHGGSRVSAKASSIFLHVEDFKHRLSRHWHHLNRAKWKDWHGNLYGASIALNCFYDGVDIHMMIAEADSSRSTRIEQVRERLAELSVSLKFGI